MHFNTKNYLKNNYNHANKHNFNNHNLIAKQKQSM